MTRAGSVVILLTLLLVASAAAAQPQPPVASPTAEARAVALGTGTEVTTVTDPGTSVRWGRAETVIDMPFDRTMRLIQDYGRYQDWMPHFRQSRVLSRRGANALVYMQASVIRNTTTLWAQLRIFARRPRAGTHVVEARMTEGNMERFQAKWELTPIEGGTRTLVSFQILVDPGLPLPNSVFSEENRKAARRTVNALRRRLTTQTRVATRRP
jgi:ribosome-associated toxin RatA of RatAB toxin-antitoxin module